MKLRYLIIGAIGFVVGWNVFLIQRDHQLFESYNQPSQSERMQ
ncbi:hypothetical protein PQC13_gp157 [Synechococcus phage S-SRM01]|uniref:Uncharacterized protein n=1 Tax=Synechococcus phage S-SRM01 TaxID=2781608 RepID=A0A879R1Q4_9CAUD|nr:hypothetical protein PQC13_gp157 [Synechococcus phage S-SRM01]QPX48122.1 hypothetical protein [Synechococcus phage S-SRM01]